MSTMLSRNVTGFSPLGGIDMPLRRFIVGIMLFARKPPLICLLLAALLASPMKTLATDGTADLTAGNTAFALDLYAQLKSGDGNLFFSPYSISTCLAMTYAGARGDTEAQMARTLHFGADQARFHSGFGELQKQLNTVQQKQEVQLNIANGLWAQKEYPFLDAFLKTATQTYDAKLNQADFRTRAEAARKEINDWVSDRTKAKITDLIAPGSLDAATRLMLVNAIYFKGKWLHEFKKVRTTDQPFFVTLEQKVQTKMMNGSAKYKYAETETLQLLELPYMGGDLSMLVLLPKQKGGLPPLENSLNQKQLNDWLARGSIREVDVFLPKFKLTQEFALAPTLEAMGMTDAFSSSADFSGMDGRRDLYISAVIHKAYVDVNEEGTEAAAATGLTLRALAMQRPEPTPVFRADHPFLFLIRDTRSGSILFLGRVTNPAK
jgi:serpin B